MKLSSFFAMLICLLTGGLLAPQAEAIVLPSGFTQSQYAGNLLKPVTMAFAPDGRLFICEQEGTLRVVKNGTLLPTPFVTLDVNFQSERGLIGIVFDPDFATNKWLYVYYTAKTPTIHNRISRFTANGDVAVAGSETVILELDDLEAAIHNGGAMQFGADGKIYVGVGENSFGPNAQVLTNLKGKMLRMNKDGSAPTDNPFYNQTTGKNRLIYAYGLRNPFNFDIQRGTSRIFANDVGGSSYEEINEIIPGRNFGWPDTQGPFTASQYPNYTNPFFAYAHGDGETMGCAITGGAFYNPVSQQFPSQYVGKYFFTDYCNGWLRYIDPTTKEVSTFATELNSLPVDLEVGPDGSMYYIALGFGAVMRIAYPNSQPPQITAHPVSTTVAVGQPVTFNVSAAGSSPLNIQWQRNNQNINGATGATYTINSAPLTDNNATFRAVVTNDFGTANSNPATLTVLNNQLPGASIDSPTQGSIFIGGQVINYSGTGTDAEDGTLPASAFTWRVDFHHDEHSHPFVPSTSGSKTGTFTIPTIGETSDNVWYRIFLTVTDSTGLSRTVTRDIFPRKVTVTVQTNPANLQVKLDGETRATPFSFTGVVGIIRNLEAVTPQVSGGNTYVFNSWSDGGAAAHNIATPTANTTYTATFTLGNSSSALSINFVGGGPKGNPIGLATTESAGLISTSNWNNAASNAGNLSALKDDRGVATTAAVSWSAHGTWSTAITETAGNARMMKGYLNTSNATTTTVSVSGIPAAYTANGYDVYVYMDGDNTGATRKANFTIGSTTVASTDSAGVDFNGNFIRSIGDTPGNYVLFSGLNGNSFVLTATPGASTDASPRAAIDGIQIVARTVVPGYRLHGRIANSSGIGIANVSVARSGSATPVLTNGAGYYTFLNVPDGTFTVTPTLTGYTFTPASKSITISGAESINNNFIGSNGPVVTTYRLHGRVATSGGIAIPNVSVTRSGSGTPVLTNGAGYYSFTGVPNGTYTVTPALSGYTFSPPSKSIVINNAESVNNNFTGSNSPVITTYRLHGRVATSGGIAIPNVSVTRSGSATPVITNGAGYYTFTGVPNGTYTVTPTLSGYTFTPVNKSITINGAESINNNFVGSNGPVVPTYRIAGRIATSNGIGIPNVSVLRSGSATPVLTNGAGYYNFAAVPNGNYTITPSLSGYTFTPANKSVSVSSADAVNHNFVGTGP